MRRRIEVEIERGGDKSVREEDRHHKQVLVTVELSFVLLQNANPVQLLVHVCEVDRLVNEQKTGLETLRVKCYRAG